GAQLSQLPAGPQAGPAAAAGRARPPPPPAGPAAGGPARKSAPRGPARRRPREKERGTGKKTPPPPRRHPPPTPAPRPPTKQGADPRGDLRPHPVQRAYGVPPEPHRVIVASIQRQPGHRLATGWPPAGRQTAPSQPAGQSCRTRLGQTPRPRWRPRPRPAGSP